MLGGLNAFFLLIDRPEVYRLPPDPQMPSRNLFPATLWSVLGGIVVGLTFLVSAASSSAALLILLGYRRWHTLGGIEALERFDSLVLVLELVVLVVLAALVASLGSIAWVWFNAWGALLVVGVVILGILVPLLLHARPRTIGHDLSVPVGAVLVLVGAFVLRVVVVMSSEGLGVV